MAGIPGFLSNSVREIRPIAALGSEALPNRDDAECRQIRHHKKWSFAFRYMTTSKLGDHDRASSRNHQ